MPPRCSSRHSFRVISTTVTHCCTVSTTDYFVTSSRCRMLPPAWSQALILVTTLHQCYSSCTGCQSINEWCLRSPGLYISLLLVRLMRTSVKTVAFCRTPVVAHCGPTLATCGSCSCRIHITNLVIGVSRPPVHDWNNLPPRLQRPGLSFDSFRQSLRSYIVDY